MYEHVQKSYKSGVKDARLHNGGLWIEDSDSSRGQTYSFIYLFSIHMYTFIYLFALLLRGLYSLSIYLNIYPSLYLSFFISIYLSIFITIYFSIRYIYIIYFIFISLSISIISGEEIQLDDMSGSSHSTGGVNDRNKLLNKHK